MRFETMTVKQLDKLIADATEAREAKRVAEREAVKMAVTKQLAEHGLTIHDVFGVGKRGPRKGAKVAPKYRDKDGNTWTGRGRQPLWLTAALKKGAKIEQFALNGHR